MNGYMMQSLYPLFLACFITQLLFINPEARAGKLRARHECLRILAEKHSHAYLGIPQGNLAALRIEWLKRIQANQGYASVEEELLLASFEPYMHRMAKQVHLAHPHIPITHLVQEARWGVYRYRFRFDHSRGVPANTYFNRVIWSAIRNYALAQSRFTPIHFESIEEQGFKMLTEQGNDVYETEFLMPEAIAEVNVRKLALSFLLRNIDKSDDDPRSKDIWKKIFGLSKLTQQDLAQQYHCVRQNISRLEMKMRETLGAINIPAYLHDYVDLFKLLYDITKKGKKAQLSEVMSVMRGKSPLEVEKKYFLTQEILNELSLGELETDLLTPLLEKWASQEAQ